MNRREFFCAAVCASLMATLPSAGMEVSEIQFVGPTKVHGNDFYSFGWKVTVDGKKYGDFIVFEDKPTESDIEFVKDVMRDQAERSIVEIGRLA